MSTPERRVDGRTGGGRGRVAADRGGAGPGEVQRGAERTPNSRDPRTEQTTHVNPTWGFRSVLFGRGLSAAFHVIISSFNHLV